MIRAELPTDHEELDKKYLETVWKHVKSGGVYMIIAIALNSDNLQYEVVYEELSGRTWTRSYNEFMDGRFIQIHQ